MIKSYFCIILSVLFLACHDSKRASFISISPSYSDVEIISTNDSIHVELDPEMSPIIKTLNYFNDKGIDYISLYDENTELVTIHSLKENKQVNKINLRKVFDKRSFYKTTVFCKNLDTLLVNNNNHLYILNKAGNKVDSIQFKNTPYSSLSAFSNDNPAIIYGKYIFAESRPRLAFNNKTDLKRWKIIYKFDLNGKSSALHYPLPKKYIEREYSYTYFYPSYCFNDKNRLVISFQADTNIYETDLEDVHNEYFGKSKFNKKVIAGRIKGSNSSDERTRDDMFNDAYGSIYFDHNRKTYLRVAQVGLSKKDYFSKQWRKEQSVIIFNEQFKIIGESSLDRDINLSSLFITKSGDIYARARMEDKNIVHFIRLMYKDLTQSLNLTKTTNTN